MMAAPIVQSLLFYGGFAVGVVGLFCVGVGGVATMEARKRPALPQAVIVANPPRNGVLWQLLGAFALIGGPAASIWIWSHSSNVVFVQTDAGHPSTPRIVRQVWIGADYAAPRSLDSVPARRATWIVNQSDLPVRAHRIGYGDSSSSGPLVIPPGASLPVESVDFVGPNHPPPDEITVLHSKELANAGVSASAKRVWLTW